MEGISSTLQNIANTAELVVIDNLAPQYNMFNQLATTAGPIRNIQSH